MGVLLVLVWVLYCFVFLHLLRIKELQEICELGLTASLKLLLVRDLLPHSLWQFS